MNIAIIQYTYCHIIVKYIYSFIIKCSNSSQKDNVYILAENVASSNSNLNKFPSNDCIANNNSKIYDLINTNGCRKCDVVAESLKYKGKTIYTYDVIRFIFLLCFNSYTYI